MFNVFYAKLSYIEQFNIIKGYVLDNYNVINIDNIVNSEIFYDIPFHYGFRINLKGLVYDVIKDTLISHTLNKSGYPAVTVIKDNAEKSVTTHVHRLLALTFIHNDKGICVN